MCKKCMCIHVRVLVCQRSILGGASECLAAGIWILNFDMIGVNKVVSEDVFQNLFKLVQM